MSKGFLPTAEKSPCWFKVQERSNMTLDSMFYRSI